MPAPDITGQVFGTLKVVARAKSKCSKARWSCRCTKCGVIKEVRATHLRARKVVSCGKCLHTTHGEGESRLYGVWRAMRQRCSNPNHPEFKNYGGRGIEVCVEWEDFAVFKRSMGPRPEGYTIDRIDNEGDYAPGNCRWATSAQQSQNQRTTKLDPVSVILIRALRARGVTNKVLAYNFGVTTTNIGAVVKHHSWKNPWIGL